MPILGSMLASEVLLSVLEKRLDAETRHWLASTCAGLSAGASPSAVFTAFASAGRKSGKGLLLPDEDVLEAAERAVPGWDPSGWTLAEAARALVLLALPPGPGSAKLMDQLYETADVGEAVALLKALPLLPGPELHLARAREGARSNVKSQFEAVALRNPYPARHFDEAGWNQLVAKALFVGSPLDLIVGLYGRGNAALARMLVDHVAERTAAGRPYDQALWNCVDPHAQAAGIAARAAALRSQPATPSKTE